MLGFRYHNHDGMAPFVWPPPLAFDLLEKGDHLNFKASLLSMGNEFKLNHLRLVSEEGAIQDTGKTEDFDHISIKDVKLP